MEKQRVEDFEAIYNDILSKARGIGNILDEYEDDDFESWWIGIERVWLSSSEVFCLCSNSDSRGNIYRQEKRFPRYWLYLSNAEIRDICEERKREKERRKEDEEYRLYKKLKTKFENV